MRAPRPTAPDFTASIIISAHNEERTIGRLLTQLCRPVAGAHFEVLVLCNGCTDDTAGVARGFGVTVVELAAPGKYEAMRLGDEMAQAFPRVYLDADVEITAADVHRLSTAVGPGRFLAVAPARHQPMDGVSRWVRWYYEVWQNLPQVRTGLYGRGIIVVSEEANDRIRRLPKVMSDDLAMAEVVLPAERAVLSGATVTVWPPKTLRDLLHRRIRVATGNTQADEGKLRADVSRSTPRTLIGVARRSPRLVFKLPVFIGVTLAARTLARRAVRAADFTTWRRDESSRS